MDESKNKWLYLIGYGLNHVRSKSFVNVINDLLYSYKEDYEICRFLSRALGQVILGVGDLYGGVFVILNTTQKLFYDGYL